MKKLAFFIAGLLIFINLNAQNPDTSYWEVGGISNIAFNQTSFKYWSAGGNNSVAVNGVFGFHANYAKDKVSWKNTLDLGYGTQKSMGLPFRKTDDKIDFASKFGYKAANKFYYTGLLNFNTQMTKGFEYLDNGDSNLVSTFLAPAYVLYSAGIDYLPNSEFSIYTSPLTAKTTLVMDPDLSAEGAFGVDSGKTVRNEFGAYIKIEMAKKITDDLTINSKVGLFSNYLHNPQNIDVNFDLLASLKVTKFISVTFSTQMIYDDDILILVDPLTGRKGKRLQIKEIFGLGVSYTF